MQAIQPPSADNIGQTCSDLGLLRVGIAPINPHQFLTGRERVWQLLQVGKKSTIQSSSGLCSRMQVSRLALNSMNVMTGRSVQNSQQELWKTPHKIV